MQKVISDDIYTIYRSWLISEIAKSDRKEHIVKLILERCLTGLTSDTSYNAFTQDSGLGSHNTVYDYLNTGILKSQLIENLVCNKLAASSDKLYFYQNIYEIDFVCGNTLCEVKYKNRIVKSDYNYLLSKDHYRKILITKNKLQINKELLILPIECFLLSNWL